MPEPTTSEPSSPDISVFVAHRSEDQDVLNRVVSTLRVYCGDRAQFLFARDIPAGINWREWIKQNITNSNHFWLFYTDPNARWGWPLYEAGIFTGVSEAAGDITRLVCFHREKDRVPDALADFQAVSLTPDGVISFLHEFFATRVPKYDIPLNANVMNDDEMVEGINAQFLRLAEGDDDSSPPFRLYNKFIDLEFTFLDKAGEEEIRMGRISSGSNFEDIFGLYALPDTWGALLETIMDKCSSDEEARKTYDNWIDELHMAIRSASQKSVFKQPGTSFLGLEDEKPYLPILHGMSMKPNLEEGSKSASARVLFVKRDDGG